MTVAATTGSPEASLIRWRVLLVMMLASFVSYVLRYNVSTAGPSMMADLGITELHLGYMASAMSVGYALFQLPGGMLTDAVGPRRTLTWLIVIWIVLTLLTSVVPAGGGIDVATTVVMLVLIRFLVGAVHAPIFPLVGGVIERWFPIGHWALPNGLTSTALTLGSAATAPLLVWLIGEYGWRPAFAMMTPLALLALVLWWWQIRDEPQQHPAVTEAEVQLIKANRPAAHLTEDSTPNWRRMLRNRSLLLLLVAYASMNYVFYLFFYWVFYYLVNERGIGEQAASYVVSLQWICAAVGGLVGGLVCDWACGRYGMRWGCAAPAIFGLVLSGLLFAIGSQSSVTWVVVISFALSFFFNQMTEAAFWTAAISVGGRHAATACGVMNTGGNGVGIVVGPLAPLTAATLGWGAAMMTGTLFALVGAFIWLFIRADRPASD